MHAAAMDGEEESQWSYVSLDEIRADDKISSFIDARVPSSPSVGQDMKGMIGDFDYIENRWIGNYRFVKQLGTGSSSKVVLGCDIRNGEKVAIKIVPRRIADGNESEAEIRCDQRIFREVVISSVLSHPHIVKLKNFLYSPTHYFLIFEYVNGRQLYDIVLNEGPLSEQDAQKYFRQLLSAIEYIHRNSIVHRDLKIENVLIDEDDNVKLIDFGLSNFYDNKMLLNTFCGSLYFAAPELLFGQRYCGPEIDVWSLGVVLYVLLCGCVPFDDENVQGLQEKIKQADFSFCKTISRDAAELIRGMILAQPSSRLGLEQIIASKWVNGGKKGKINSYVPIRCPVMKINELCIRRVSRAVRFQFPNMEREVRRFHRICQEDVRTLEQAYWSRRPVISLYYLACESLRGTEENLDDDEGEWKSDGQLEDIHEFVRFTLYSEGEVYCERGKTAHFLAPNQESLCSSHGSKCKEAGYPRIRQTYLKGFFKGIRVKHIGSQNAVKKILLDIFNINGIAYEATEKSYLCSVRQDGLECYFKVSMYFNVLLNEYYLTITPLSSDRKFFRSVYEWIYTGMKNRA